MNPFKFKFRTEDEFAKRNGFRLSNYTKGLRRQKRQIDIQYFKYDKNEELPGLVDWRYGGFVTPIRDQVFEG